MRSASAGCEFRNFRDVISILALHAERVAIYALNANLNKLISILALHAERVPRERAIISHVKPFQSSRSMRSASPDMRRLAVNIGISILALHAERVPTRLDRPMTRRYFNPRAPCGARPSQRPVHFHIELISIHALHAERVNIMDSPGGCRW